MRACKAYKYIYRGCVDKCSQYVGRCPYSGVSQSPTVLPTGLTTRNVHMWCRLVPRSYGNYVLIRYVLNHPCESRIAIAIPLHPWTGWRAMEIQHSRIVGLWVSVSHDLAAVPDACAYAGNTCLWEHYMYEFYIISWLFIRILFL